MHWLGQWKPQSFGFAVAGLRRDRRVRRAVVVVERWCMVDWFCWSGLVMIRYLGLGRSYFVLRYGCNSNK